MCFVYNLMSIIFNFWLVILMMRFFFFFFKQKTAYEMRISDWSSDVCSSDLGAVFIGQQGRRLGARAVQVRVRQAGVRELGQHLHPHMLRHSLDRKSVV